MPELPFGEPLAFADPEFPRAFDNMSVVVTVGERESKQVALNLISAARLEEGNQRGEIRSVRHFRAALEAAAKKRAGGSPLTAMSTSESGRELVSYWPIEKENLNGAHFEEKRRRARAPHQLTAREFAIRIWNS